MLTAVAVLALAAVLRHSIVVEKRLRALADAQAKLAGDVLVVRQAMDGMQRAVELGLGQIALAKARAATQADAAAVEAPGLAVLPRMERYRRKVAELTEQSRLEYLGETK